MSVETSTDLEYLTEQLSETRAALERMESERDTALYTIDQLSEQLVATRAATNTASRAQFDAAVREAKLAHDHAHNGRFPQRFEDTVHAVAREFGMTVVTR